MAMPRIHKPKGTKMPPKGKPPGKDVGAKLSTHDVLKKYL